jgi:DNA-binding NarL/FixJ family response regulator
MPGMPGSELLSVIRRLYPAIQVIAMSSAFSGSEVPIASSQTWRFFPSSTF